MIDVLWEAFVEPFQYRSFQKALLGGSLVAISCGLIGCFVILRRMAFLGDAVAHAMLAGVTAGYLAMQLLFGHEAHTMAMLVGSMLAGLITVAMVGFVSRVSRIKEDTAIGIMYTGMFAAGGVLHSLFSDRIHIDLYHFVIGTVFAIQDSDLWMMALITVTVLAIVILLFRQLADYVFRPRDGRFAWNTRRGAELLAYGLHIIGGRWGSSDRGCDSGGWVTGDTGRHGVSVE